jgi:CRP-like cAMP-binding protein
MAGDIIETFQAILGRSFSRAEAEQVANATRAFPVPARRTVVREGDPGSGLYFLVSGQVEILKARKDGSVERLAVVEAPSMLGEISLVTEEPHTATARALTDCDLRVLSRAEWSRWLATGQLTAYKLMGAVSQLLARRLMRINDVVLELTAAAAAAGGAAAPPDLERVRQKLFSEWAF